jgi:hypothetical protein
MLILIDLLSTYGSAHYLAIKIVVCIARCRGLGFAPHFKKEKKYGSAHFLGGFDRDTHNGLDLLDFLLFPVAE